MKVQAEVTELHKKKENDGTLESESEREEHK